MAQLVSSWYYIARECSRRGNLTATLRSLRLPTAATRNRSYPMYVCVCVCVYVCERRRESVVEELAAHEPFHLEILRATALGVTTW